MQQKRALQRNDVCGSFRIVRFLARGRVSEVYEAEDDVTGQRVAIKTLARPFEVDTLARKRMEAETALLNAIDHPNVIRVLGSGEREGLPFRAMEYAAGKTLRARFDASPEPISVAVGLCFARQVVDAVGALHSTGAAHGALTPESILLTEIEEVKLVDLGDAPLEGRGYKGRRLAHAEASAARYGEEPEPSLRYAAPELLRGARADERTDVYSVGVVLYEMLAGTHPLEARSLLRSRKGRGEAPGEAAAGPLPLTELYRGFPASTWAIIAKAIAPDPRARFASMAELGDAINDGWNALLEHNRAGADLNAALSLLTQALQVGVGPGGDAGEVQRELEALIKQLTEAADLAEGVVSEEEGEG